MADMLRPDGRPFVTDKRGAVPRYVIEGDHEGRKVVRNQFTGDYEVIFALCSDEVENRKLAFKMLRQRENRQEAGLE
jgi:hypothetical protein